MYEAAYDQRETLEKAPFALQGAVTNTPPTARKQLEQRKAMLVFEMQKIDDALAALDKHPELEAFTETLKRALR